MKVLHIVPALALQHGGVVTSVRELTKSLADIGVQTHVWTTRRGYDRSINAGADQALIASGVELRYFPVHAWHWLGHRYAYSAQLHLSLRGELPQFDLVHIHALWLYPTAVAARLCRLRKIPYVISPCGALDPYGMGSHWLFKRIYGFLVERKNLSGASAIHFTSCLEQKRAELFGIKVPTVIIPRPITREAVRNLPRGAFRAQHPEVQDRKIILFLGRLHPKKRPDLVAQAFSLICQKRGDIHLVLAGPDQGSVKQVRRTLEQTNVLQHTTFLDWISGPDKWALYGDSCLFLLPSEDENFGVSALEAMAAKIPVLLSPSVGIAEWVAQAEAGMVLQPEAARWASAMSSLLDDQRIREAMGKRGYQLAWDRFGGRRIAEQMRGVYSRLCGGEMQ